MDDELLLLLASCRQHLRANAFCHLPPPQPPGDDPVSGRLGQRLTKSMNNSTI
jgi:hypothetical protein